MTGKRPPGPGRGHKVKQGSGVPASGMEAGGAGNGKERPAFEPGNPGILAADQPDKQAAGWAARAIIVAAAEDAARLKVAEMRHDNAFIAAKARSEVLTVAGVMEPENSNKATVINVLQRVSN